MRPFGPARAADSTCVLCGHRPACGFAEVIDDRDNKRQLRQAFLQGVGSILDLSGRTLKDRPLVRYVRLCHADDHSCYNKWTFDGKRPE